MKSVVLTLIVLLFPSLAWACGPMFAPTYTADYLVTGAVAGAVTLLVMRRNDPSLAWTSQLMLVGAWAVLSYFVGALFANDFSNTWGPFARFALIFYALTGLAISTSASSRVGKLLLSAVVVAGLMFSVVLFMQTDSASQHSLDVYRAPVETEIVF